MTVEVSVDVDVDGVAVGAFVGAGVLVVDEIEGAFHVEGTSLDQGDVDEKDRSAFCSVVAAAAEKIVNPWASLHNHVSSPDLACVRASKLVYFADTWRLTSSDSSLAWHQVSGIRLPLKDASYPWTICESFDVHCFAAFGPWPPLHCIQKVS